MFWFMFYLLLSLMIFVSLVLILLILIQKGRGGGLASAFGGMGGNTAFGSKTGDVLTWATSIVFGVFLLLAIVLNLMANRTVVRAPANPAQNIPAAPTDTGGEPAPTPAQPEAPVGR